jgi:hypothetical protein
MTSFILSKIWSNPIVYKDGKFFDVGLVSYEKQKKKNERDEKNGNELGMFYES